MYTVEQLIDILGLEYFTIEQIHYMVLKLNDRKTYSLYLQQVMAADIKRVRSNI